MTEDVQGSLPLLLKPPRRPVASHSLPALTDPVAGVVVDLPLPHLDRVFDYEVSVEQDADARPGVRVRVRFAGRLVDAWLVERKSTTDSGRALSRIERVVSPDPVLTPATLRLARAVAERYVGTLADVLRSAVPPRHARAEAALDAEGGMRTDLPPGPAPAVGAVGWGAYRGGPEMLAGIAEGADPHAAWTALPREDWPARVAELVGACREGGRDALVVVPDKRDIARVTAALGLAGIERVVLRGDQPSEQRYGSYLRARRGLAHVVIGTRAAAFAPLCDVGLIVLWDDGDDSLADPRAPYWHAREVLFLRAQQQPCALVVGAFGRSVDVARAVRTGWLTDVSASRVAARAAAPTVHATGSDPLEQSARLPRRAFEVVRLGLQSGPVLVSVPRAGYVPGLACANCRSRAGCTLCGGPLALARADAVPTCRWCSTAATAWRCPVCDGTRMRATSHGEERTADELGRAFGGVSVLRSGAALGAGRVLATVGPKPALVVATPGAEPYAPDGYAAALLLDGWALLDRPDVRADEEAARRWFAALAQIRAGAPVVVVADGAHPVVQALIRWDPAGFADSALRERRDLGLPPAARLAEISGSYADVVAVVEAARLPPRTRVLGPTLVDRQHRAGSAPEVGESATAARALLSVAAPDGPLLAAALRSVLVERSLRKAGGPVAVRVDPVHLE